MIGLTDSGESGKSATQPRNIMAENIAGFTLFLFVAGLFVLGVAAVLMPIFVIMISNRLVEVNKTLRRLEYLMAIFANKP